MTRLQGEIVRRIDAMQESYERGRADERAKNVALLRKWAAEMLEVEPSLDDKLGAEPLRNAADQLEAGP